MSAKKDEQKSLLLTLPWIVSVNQLYKRRSMAGGGRGMMMTTKGLLLKKEIGYIAKSEMMRQGYRRIPKPIPVAMTLLWYPPDRRVRDGSNLLKLLEDSLNMICFDDDSQIVEHHIYKESIFKGGKVVVELRESEHGK